MKSLSHPQTGILLAFVMFILMSATGCSLFQSEEPPMITDTLHTHSQHQGIPITVHFNKGKAHNYPLMAIWLEDTNGAYIQTLYVAKSIAKGRFAHGQTHQGKWQPGPARRPAALPYWAHKRGVKAEDGLYIPSHENPMPDAVTGATPVNNFVLETRTKNIQTNRFRILLEINQSWDWNEYWTNDTLTDNKDYRTSCQPALVYAGEINLNENKTRYSLQPIGHSHYAGENGKLYEDLSTITSALEITDSVWVEIEK